METKAKHKIYLDSRSISKYSPIFTIVENIYTQESNTLISIAFDDLALFHEVKAYLKEKKIGFREIYDGEEVTLQFITK